MLAGVLLHVIEAAGPVDLSLDLGGRKRRFEDVRDAVVFIHDVADRDASERAHIERLSAGGWVKHGTVQICATPFIRGFDNAGVKFAQITIVVVQAFRHGAGAVISNSPRRNCQSGNS